MLRQDYKDFEIIIVDDGSTDNTRDILNEYNDERIRYIRHSENKGMALALHTGLDNIKGEWFTLLDSDDEMMPNALSTMLKVPKEIDIRINAITCNCIDAYTGKFSGKGLSKDQYLDYITIIKKCRGEFWGLTKTELLPKRNNELFLGAIWYKINKIAIRYYIHKALRIYHSNVGDNYSLRMEKINSINFQREKITVESIFNQTEMIEDYKKYGKDFYIQLCFRAGIVYGVLDEKTELLKYLKELFMYPFQIKKIIILINIFLFGKKGYIIFLKIKEFLKRIY